MIGYSYNYDNNKIYDFETKRNHCEIPECFWTLDNTQTHCDCNKIFFDVLIDFQKFRIIICKDWYTMKVKSILTSIEKEIDCSDLPCGGFDRWHIPQLQKSIIEHLIQKYFETPIYDRVMSNDEYSPLGCYRPSLFLIQIPICQRPLVTRTINILKFLEYYHFEYMAEKIYRSDSSYSIIREVHKDVLIRLGELLKNHLSANKWKEMRRLISAVIDCGTKGTAVNNLVIAILREYKFLKIKNKKL